MAIAAQRFGGFKEDFNLATSSFTSLKVNEILNTPQVVFNDLLSTAKDLVGQYKEVAQNVFTPIKSAIDQATRFTKNMYQTFTDLAKFPQTFVAGIIDDIFPGASSSVKNLLKNMTQVCRDKALGNAVNLKFKMPNPKCDGMQIGSSNCPAGPAMSLINQATGSALTSAIKLVGNLINQIVGLGNIGFGANLCGVFAAITQGLTDKSILTSAAGILLNQQGSMGNLQAVFDISKNLNDMPVLNAFPDTIKNIAENAMVPLGNFQNGVMAVAGQITGSFGAISETWDRAEDGMLSLANMGSSNEQLVDMFASAGQDESLDLDALDSIQAPENSAFYNTYAAPKRSGPTDRELYNAGAKVMILDGS